MKGERKERIRSASDLQLTRTFIVEFAVVGILYYYYCYLSLSCVVRFSFSSLPLRTATA